MTVATEPKTVDVGKIEKSESAVKDTGAFSAQAKRVQDFAFHAKTNGWFRIPGNNFMSGGKVTVGGVEAQVMSWRMTEVEGIIPEGVTSGDVVVEVDGGTKQYGYFNA